MTVTAGLLLAAGAGRRYGRPKALAEGGQWLRSSVAVLREGGCQPVRVVLGAGADEAIGLLPAPELAVIAPDWALGMSASLRAGLIALEPSPAAAVLVHLVDLPDVPATAVRRLLRHAAPGAVARACYQGRPGHPVLLGREHWAEVLAGLSGDRGAGQWLAARPDLITVECGDLASGRDQDVAGGPLA